MEKFVCIHGHFYQPPRENAWLEAIEVQDSAFPYHDWNERITAECYAPNVTARIMDDDNRIERMVNTYARISFNFGPTLLAWMKEHAKETYAALIHADGESQKRFSGHGSALAQAYNHMILPLANPRDKTTQVIWGIRDFESRFGRKPEGMWLAETAADLPTLDVLAEHGIRFTILSPYQARRTRRIGAAGKWRDSSGGKIDPSVPYLVRLPSGRTICVFFYDGPISRAVAFEKLLTDGKRFAHRLTDAFDERRSQDQLVHIATDGESYGHHHRQGEMALAYALQYIEDQQLARVTNYGEYLDEHPPAIEAEIHDKSSWSCVHGVERWWRDCGCNSGGNQGWNQGWRTPLREALDWLRDELAPRFESKAADYFSYPWQARDNYVELILDRSDENVMRFFEEHACRPLTEEDRIVCLHLLEMQRHAMLMYTSCGWFFDELSGIETVQIIQYAGRAIQLAAGLFQDNLEEGFLKILERAKCNVREHRDGRLVYEKFVKPAMMDRERIAAHFAVLSLFEGDPERDGIYAFNVRHKDRQFFRAGRSQLAIGRVMMTFAVTRNAEQFSYCVLHFGDHNINGGVRHWQGAEAYETMSQDIREAFDRADFPELIRRMDRHFGESHYSLKSLFRDEQRNIVSKILTAAMTDVENNYRQIGDSYTPLMRSLSDMGVPLPKALQVAESFVLNADLRAQLENDQPDLEQVHYLLQTARDRNVTLERDVLSFKLTQTLERLIEQFARDPDDDALLRRLEAIASLLPIVAGDANLWKIQNIYYALLKAELPGFRGKAAHGVGTAQDWVEAFLSLGDRLGFKIHLEPEPGGP